MVHVDKPLTDISVAYTQSDTNFIASRVFPTINVTKQSDKYFVFDRNTFMRDQAQKRGSGEESAGSGYTLSTDSYFCDVWALHKDISDFDRANTDAPLNADRNAATFIAQQFLIRKEKQFVDDFLTTGVWGTDKTVAAQWSDYTGSDPLADVDVGKETILTATGQLPNTLVMNFQVFNKLKNHPDIVDRIKYTSSRVVTEEVLASLFGVDQVLVPKAVMDTSVEGLAASTSLILGKHALLCHVAKNPGIEVPSAGYCFAWSGLAPGLANGGMTMGKFRMDNLLSDRIEGHLAIENKVVGSQLGYFFSSVVA